ncbi:MAG TPA: hypothetical protein VMS99_09205 [Acidimicrobiia bacterium]|nr:hypothetical protein [Acidimicrobiia bacterium]
MIRTMEDPDSAPRGKLRAWLVTLAAAVSLVGIVLATTRGPLAETSDGLWALSWLAWPVAGWMVLTRRPGNKIGQLSMAIGAIMGLAFGLQSMVLDVDPTAAAWVELAYTVLGIAPWLLIVAVLNTFPRGNYAGRWEAFLGRALIVVGLWALLGFTISPEPLVDTGLDNPLALPELSALAVITNESGFFLVVILGIAALARLFARGKRSAGTERQQFRWLFLGGGVFVVNSGAGQFLPENSSAELLFLLGGWSIPISIGVAVVRYRLYEIDRIISRTIGYMLVVGSLAIVGVVTVTLLTSVLPAESPLAVAASTLAVAALFNPLRRRVREWVDRRFNRARYDAQRVIERFVGSLQGRLDHDGVVDGWVDVVAETMQPASVAVWVRGAK